MSSQIAAFVGTVLFFLLIGELGVNASLHCAMRREISPCTCRREEPSTGAIHVVCQRINTYEEIAKALTNKFNPKTKIGLDISYSQLPDFATHSLRELGLSITKLKLNYDNLSDLRESVFSKLDQVTFLSIADNEITSMPRHVLKNLPHLQTLDLCRNKLTILTEEDFKDIQQMENLLLAANEITEIEKNSFPKSLRHIHLGLNNLHSLNGSLKDLSELKWIFINTNHLKTIENELPIHAEKLVFINAANNKLRSLPSDFKLMPSLQSLYFYDNNLKSLDGVFQKSINLIRIGLSFNKIEYLKEDDFVNASRLSDLDIAYNQLKSLNGSLRYLKSLRYLNLTHNQLTEFSFQEIKGLKRLSVIDLSYNRITHLASNSKNLLNVETRVLELRLDHNLLHTIGGTMMGLRGLLRLNLSHNLIEQITTDDLIGLDELRLLDISFNQITTLEEASKTFLPALEELISHHNNITVLDKDFHGLPSLCLADFSYNRIMTINYDLVSKTRCSINGVPSLLKIYLQDNPVLCGERMYELVRVLENFNARISGLPSCLVESPSSNRLSLGDHYENVIKPPVIVVAQMLPHPTGAETSSHSYRRVGALLSHINPDSKGMPYLVDPPITLLPSTANVVVKWSDPNKSHGVVDYPYLHFYKTYTHTQ